MHKLLQLLSYLIFYLGAAANAVAAANRGSCGYLWLPACGYLRLSAAAAVALAAHQTQY
jgi:hypothetical protein